MTKIKMTAFLFIWLFITSSSPAQETTREEKGTGPAKEVQTTKQRDKQGTKVPKASASSWEKLSDQQIARIFFPKEKLYFPPFTGELPRLDPALFDGVAVTEVKRVVANFDDDPEEEMAVLVQYSTGVCTSCLGAFIAILDSQGGKIRIAWRNEEGEAYRGVISTVKLIKRDKFFQLLCTCDTNPPASGVAREMKIIRWNGKKFSTIWTFEVERHFSGAAGSLPHDYLAKTDLIDDAKGFKRIKVSAIYTTRPHRGEERVQSTLEEEFVWDEKKQTYHSVRQREVKYEKGQTCVSYRKHASKSESQCYGETAYQRGTEYLRQGDSDQAIRALSEALELNPRSANAYSNRGFAHTQKREYDKAIADFNEALKIDPKSADTHRYRGFAYLQKGQLDQAISDYTKALEIDPKSADVYFDRAIAYKRKGQYDLAISDYTKASELKSGDPWNYISRGTVYYEKGEYDLAIADYTTALGMEPIADWAYYARGLAYWKKGQYDQAIADLNRAVGNPNVVAEVYYYRGRVYMDKRDHDRAVSDFDKAIELTSNRPGVPFYIYSTKKPEIYFYTAQAYERAGLTRKAIDTYEALIQDAPSGTSPLVEHARERIAELKK